MEMDWDATYHLNHPQTAQLEMPKYQIPRWDALGWNDFFTRAHSCILRESPYNSYTIRSSLPCISISEYKSDPARIFLQFLCLFSNDAAVRTMRCSGHKTNTSLPKRSFKVDCKECSRSTWALLLGLLMAQNYNYTVPSRVANGAIPRYKNAAQYPPYSVCCPIAMLDS